MVEKASQEIDEVVEVEEEVVADELDTDEAEVELDDDGNPIKAEEEKVIEAWQQTEEEEVELEDGKLPDVPVETHIKMKEKLKRRVTKRDTELETIKQELAELKKSGPAATTELKPRPKPEDFESDKLYEAAFEDWDAKRLAAIVANQNAAKQDKEAIEAHRRNTEKAVDEHYDRQAKLVVETGMKAEYFKEADTAVRQMVESVLPKQGDAVTDHIISLLGKGSEKVMFYVGRNKTASLEFQNLLSEDKTGMKAMLFLGQQKERLTNPKKQKSNAPKPPADASGDLATNPKADAAKKKYDKLHQAGKNQEAYQHKKKARLAKIDVSSW